MAVLAAVAFAAPAKQEAQAVRITGTFTTGSGGIVGTGESLWFPTPGTFRDVTSDCTRSSETRGRAVVSNGQLVLTARGKTDALTPVEWGVRQYLVRDLLEFVNDINAGIEPRDDERGSALLRVDDWKKPVAGRPRLPTPWSDRILARAIEARIAAVLPAGAVPKGQPARVRATLPLGTDDGVFTGMVLWADREAGVWPSPVTVRSTDADRCTIEAVGGDLKVEQMIRSRRVHP